MASWPNSRKTPDLYYSQKREINLLRETTNLSGCSVSLSLFICLSVFLSFVENFMATGGRKGDGFNNFFLRQNERTFSALLLPQVSLPSRGEWGDSVERSILMRGAQALKTIAIQATGFGG